MLNQLEELQDCLNETFKLLKESTELQPVLKLNLDEIEAKTIKQLELLHTNVSVMGHYNAGKSSLINVLVGKAVAPVADIPLTETFKSYAWDGIQLIDTPSLEGHYQAQDCIQAHLHQAQQIIFVLREHEVESRSVYNYLIKILSQNKRLCIVLNHQLSTEQVDLYMRRLRTHLELYAAQCNLSHQCMAELKIFPINLNTAWRAQLEKNERLLQYSGCKQLCIDLKNCLKDKIIKDEQRTQFWYEIEHELFIPVHSVLSSIQVKPEQLRSLYRSKLDLEKDRIKKHRSLRKFIQQHNEQIKPRLQKILEQNDSQVLEQQLQKLQDQLQQELSHEITTQLKNTNLTVIKQLNAKLDHLKQTQAVPNKAFYQIFLQQGRELAQQYQPTSQIKLSHVLSAKNLPSAGSLIRQNIGGLAVQVFMTAYDAYQAHQQEQHDNRRERMMRHAKYQTVEELI